MVAIAAGTVILWIAAFVGFLAGGLPTGGSAYLALATVSVVPVFVGVGALTSQLAPTRRIALELGSAIVGLSLLLRVIADTSAGAAWLRWATPLGWAEEMRPFTGSEPLVLLLSIAASVLLLVCAARIAAGRDIGTGLLGAREDANPRLRLLSSPTAQALRSERSSLIVWSASIAVFAFILGMVSTSISSAGISGSVQREIARFDVGSIETPSGYLAFVFIFFILAVSLFACAQIGAARHEEAEEQLETLLAQPVSRRRWLSGRLAVGNVRRGLYLPGGRADHMGRRRLPRTQHLPAADARGRRELPARRALLPRDRSARVCDRAASKRRCRIRARHRRHSCGS